MGKEFQTDILHDPLPKELQQPDFKKREERFSKDEEEEVERQCRESGKIPFDDVVVYGELDQPGLGELGGSCQRQDAENRHNKPEVRAQIGDKPHQQGAIIGFADYFVCIDSV